MMEVTFRLFERRERESSSQSGAGDNDEGVEVHVGSWCGAVRQYVMGVKIGSGGVVWLV